MKPSYAILATFAALVLSFCIAAAITAQASHTWWEIENNGTNRYYFGLYRVCIDRGGNSTELCYKFDVKGVKQFVEERLVVGVTTPVVKSEDQESQNLWILAFFAIIFTGMSFIVAVPTACISYTCQIYPLVPKLQCVFTAVGTILGITSVAYAYDRRDLIWKSGVKALKDDGLAGGEVEFVGRGFLFQCLYAAIEFLAFVIYVILIKLHPTSKKKIIA